MFWLHKEGILYTATVCYCLLLLNLLIKMFTGSLGAHRCRERLEFTVSAASHEDVAVTHLCCTDRVSQKSRASWREISVRGRNAKRSTHHLWCAVCTFVWFSDCLSHIHPSTGLCRYSHNGPSLTHLLRWMCSVHCLWWGGKCDRLSSCQFWQICLWFSYVYMKFQPAEVSSPVRAEGQSCPVGCLFPEVVCQGWAAGQISQRWAWDVAPSVSSVPAERASV